MAAADGVPVVHNSGPAQQQQHGEVACQQESPHLASNKPPSLQSSSLLLEHVCVLNNILPSTLHPHRHTNLAQSTTPADFPFPSLGTNMDCCACCLQAHYLTRFPHNLLGSVGALRMSRGTAAMPCSSAHGGSRSRVHTSQLKLHARSGAALLLLQLAFLALLLTQDHNSSSKPTAPCSSSSSCCGRGGGHILAGQGSGLLESMLPWLQLPGERGSARVCIPLLRTAMQLLFVKTATHAAGSQAGWRVHLGQPAVEHSSHTVQRRCSIQLSLAASCLHRVCSECLVSCGKGRNLLRCEQGARPAAAAAAATAGCRRTAAAADDNYADDLLLLLLDRCCCRVYR